MRPVNLLFVGDEFISAYGDARALGWVGRVMAHTRLDPLYPPIMWTSLPAFGETTAQLAERWPTEVGRRLVPGAQNRMVVGIGLADLESGTSVSRSRLNLANMLDGARLEHLECFVVGPPPLPHYDPLAVERLSDAMAEVCLRRAVPYVDTFHPLLGHEQWSTDVAATGGARPGQAGYGLLTWLVLHRGWYEWLGVPEQV